MTNKELMEKILRDLALSHEELNNLFKHVNDGFNNLNKSLDKFEKSLNEKIAIRKANKLRRLIKL